MARLTSIPPFTGTRGPVTIYLLRGEYHIRSRSSLTGERVKKDPVFKKTMQHATLMAKASPIALKVYALVLPLHKKHKFRCKLTGETIAWLKYGWEEEDIIAYLLKQYGQKKILAQEAPVIELRRSFRRKTPRSIDRKGRPVGPIKERKISFELQLYRLNEQAFRRQYNKELTTYPWSEYVMKQPARISYSVASSG